MNQGAIDDLRCRWLSNQGYGPLSTTRDGPSLDHLINPRMIDALVSFDAQDR